MSIGAALVQTLNTPTDEGLLRLRPFPGFEHLPTIQQPHVVAEELFGVMLTEIRGHARSNQVMLGPSEIGHPCNRWLLRRLDGQRDDAGIPWKATVGTAIHSWQEQAFHADNLGRAAHGLAERWLIEQRVQVGTVAG